MEHATFILGSYAGTAVSIALYAVWIIRRGRTLAEHATDAEMPWT